MNLSVDHILSRVALLKESIKEKNLLDLPVFNLFKRQLLECELQLHQLKNVTVHVDQQEKVLLAQKKIEKFKNKLSHPTEFPKSPGSLMLDMAAKFRKHQTLEAFEEFAYFEKKYPTQSHKVFGELWKLKGSPHLYHDYGRVAFYGKGFPCLDIERAEALQAANLDLETRLTWIIDCFEDIQHDRREEAYALFRDFEQAHPRIAQHIFWNLWQLYEAPELSSSQIARKDFGRDVFFGIHPMLEYNPKLIVQAMKEAIPDCQKLLSEEDPIRFKQRYHQVQNETGGILKSESYTSAAGKTHRLSEGLSFSTQNRSWIIKGEKSEIKPHFAAKTLFEARVQSSIAAAYDLCANGGNPLILNFGNEQELLACTTLLEAHPSTYKPGVKLLRMGPERDYEFFQEPATVAIATLKIQEADDLRSFLKVANKNGHDCLVLDLSEKWADSLIGMLEKEYKGCFKQVVFVARENFKALVHTVHSHCGDSYDASGLLLCK